MKAAAALMISIISQFLYMGLVQLAVKKQSKTPCKIEMFPN